MKNPSLSFIIPTFNRAEKISGCIESILKIGLADIEIIVVDDGSNDTTAEIVGCIPDPQKKIRLLTNNNNFGVSFSRNRGLEEAQGEWVCFVDSDDKLNYEEFVSWYEKCKQFEAELFIAKFTINGGPIQIEDYGNIAWICRNNEELITSYMTNPVGNSILTYVWAKLFKLNFIRSNKILFDEMLAVYEDTDFIARILAHKPRIYCAPDQVYDYYQPRGLKMTAIENPLGFEKALQVYSEVLPDREAAAALKKCAVDCFLVKTLVIELTKKNPLIFLKFLDNFFDKVSDIDYRNIKNKTLRRIVRFRIHTSMWLFVAALLIFRNAICPRSDISPR
jgi:glycosyltransferase involved in cell wall biosynthesis